MGIELAVMALGAAMSVKSNMDAKKAANKQAKEARRRAEVENIRNTRKAIRESRLAAGGIANSAALGGGMGSSGEAGAMGSTQSQTGSQVGAIQQGAASNAAMAGYQAEGARASANAASWGAVGNLAGTMFQNSYGGAGADASLGQGPGLDGRPNRAGA